MKGESFKIEKGVPIPPHATTSPLNNTLRAMKCGDSIVVPLAKRVGLPQRAKHIGIKIVTRKISDTEARIWRVK